MAGPRYDAVVVGAGPNGLAAAITLARAGRSVLVREAQETLGGGSRSADLTLPGFVHDVCSAIHPLAAASPFFRTLPLAEHGLEFIEPPAPLAHPLDDGSAVLAERGIDATAAGLGADGDAYRRLFEPLVRTWPELESYVLGPLLRVPPHPLAVSRFALAALRPARSLARAKFEGERARAMLAGVAAHSILPLEEPASASFGLVLLTLAHSVGWPVPRGGAQSIADALAAHLRSLGGEIEKGKPVSTLEELPPAQDVLLDLTPRQVLALAGGRLPPRYRRALRRYRYGPAAFKVDFALAGPVPWAAAECSRAATVHLGGSLDEIAAAERAVWRGEHPERPFVLVAQPSLFDPGRAPAGRHTLWTYCHVPNGSTFEMTERIEQQIERFAPGFRESILARSVRPPAAGERENANLVGGDIGGGAQDLRQVLARPALRLVPYRTPIRGLYLCSASTPPGGGVHGMCGYNAARAVLRARR
jgi:phytoene dehydrogenase-like protein